MGREGWKQSEAWWHLLAFRKTKEFRKKDTHSRVKEVYSKGGQGEPFREGSEERPEEGPGSPEGPIHT